MVFIFLYSANTEEHGPEITPYLDTFPAVLKAFFSRGVAVMYPVKDLIKSFLRKNMFN